MLESMLSRVRPTELGELLKSMVQREPSQRPSANKALHTCRGTLLDECFYSFASGFFGRLRLMDQHSQAAELCDSFELLIRELGPRGGGASIRAAAAGSVVSGVPVVETKAAAAAGGKATPPPPDLSDPQGLAAMAAAATANTAGYLRRAEEEMRVAAEKGVGAGGSSGTAKQAETKAELAKLAASASAVATAAAERVASEEEVDDADVIKGCHAASLRSYYS